MVLMPPMLYALILTMSRGGFIALLVVGLLVFKESSKKFRLLGLAVVVIIGALSVMTPVQKDRYLSLVDRDTAGGASAEGRIAGMIREFELGFTRPIVGHGLGTTAEAKFHKIGSAQASHNLYAEVLIELGSIGFVLFLILLYRVAQKLFEMRKIVFVHESDESSYYVRLYKAMNAVFWMYAVYSINYWGLSQYYWYFFAGLAISVSRIIESSKNMKIEKSNTADVPDNRFSNLVRLGSR